MAARKTTGKKRGPKKGYKQTKAHRDAISKGMKQAHRSGKMKRKSKTKTVSTHVARHQKHAKTMQRLRRQRRMRRSPS